MAKRGAARRRPGDEPEFPALMKRPYRSGVTIRRLADLDVVAIRRRLGLSQTRFAHRFAFPVATLRHWEQGSRKPRGCALALLHVIDYHPAVAARAILRARIDATPPEPQSTATSVARAVNGSSEGVGVNGVRAPNRPR